MEDTKDQEVIKLRRKIGVFGGVAVNVGIMIGSGIFLTPAGVLAGSGSIGLSLIVWFLSGIFSLIGALCLAELGTMIPAHGGLYSYIQYAFGPSFAFLFQWVGVVILQPGALAISSLTFASYTVQPFYPDLDCSPPPQVMSMLATVCILLVAAINVLSVRTASFVQETFTVMKVVALAIIIIVGVIELGKGNTENFQKPFEGSDARGLGIAFFAGLYAYAGWYSLNNVVEEMKDPYKNLPRCIVISVLLVTMLYVFTNVAYFTVLTKDEILASDAVAATFGDRSLGKFAWLMPLSVVISTFGNVNGFLLTTSRLYFAGARDHNLPVVAAFIHPTTRTPVPAILFITFTTLLYTLSNNVYTLITYFSFVIWTGMGVTIAGLLYLRWKEPETPRPYKVHILLPIIFLVACIGLVVMGTIARPIDTLIGLALACTGIPVYFLLVRPTKLPKWFNKLIVVFTNNTQKLLQVVETEKDD